jgi:hypothetical protein
MGSSSYELNLPCRVHRCLSPADTRSAEHLPWGPASPSRHERMKSTCYRASHTRLRFALSVFHTLGDFLLHTPCGLVSSHCHVRDSHLREFPRCQVGSPRRRVVPSCRWRDSPASELPPWRQIHPPRLQGFGPSSGPLRPTSGLDLLSTRSPHVFSNSCGLCFSCLGDAFTSPPLMTFRAKHSLYTQRRAFSVSIGNQPDDLSPDQLPVRDLRPTHPHCRSNTSK